ncbi:hypothetical protein [Desulfovibrio sp.]|uniref:hypothetical protein n=1 Tax=Desulfovibrio sp. TaxID=885 RepID=UPI0025C14FCA|nr:hypothetical protein [Desulfovibrio sp.]
MAFAHVNPLTALWQRRGLSCLLMPEGFDAFAPRRAESAATPPVRSREEQPRYGSAARQPAHAQGVQGGAKAPGSPDRQSRPEGQGSSFRQAAAPSRGQGAPPSPVQEQGSGHRPAPVPAEGGQSAQPSGSRLWKPLTPDLWPTPWRRQLEKTRPGLVLWTYWNLGLDLCNAQAEGQMERRGFLQKLLQDLAHPAGTHTFWPASLPDEGGAEPAVPPAVPAAREDGLAPHADAFWSGASRLGARGVVVMGSAAVKALGLPSGLRPLQQARYRGHMVWVLWDVDYMQREDQRYASMLAFLRQALRQVTR